MLEYIEHFIEAITSCFNRMACNCHTHLCSCCDISIDVIRRTPLGRSYTHFFDKNDGWVFSLNEN